MARPTKLRHVCCLPQSNQFGPLDGSADKEHVHMTIDEYETIRLIDFDGLNQTECAKQMNISRTTVQGIYTDARNKIADSLVNNKILLIEGGDYELYHDGNSCNKKCHHHKHQHDDGVVHEHGHPH